MCVLFASLRPLERAENLKAIYDAYDGEKQYVHRSYHGVIEDLHSGKYRLIVADELLDDTPGKWIFIGHGMGAGKTYGFDQPRPYFHRPDLITYATASSKDMVPHVAKQLGIPESKVIPLGMPRTDAYFNMKPDHKKEKNHLYVPTFRREDGGAGWLPDLNLVWRLLPEGHKFIVKPHIFTGNPVISVWSNIATGSAFEPSTPYLINADTVVTDYSSIMFDAMVLRKPVVLFAKDKEAYMRNRGMYCEYPGGYSQRYAETEEQMVKEIQEAQWNDFDEERREHFCGACDGHSIERLIELIRGVL